MQCTRSKAYPEVRMSSWVNFILVGCLVFFADGESTLTPAPRTTYLVNVTTSSELNAEPAIGDKVSIKITGEKGATDFKELRRVANSFDKGSESEFTITAKDVGKIIEIIIKKTATGKAEAWKLTKLKIEDSQGTIYEFNCNCWFSTNSGLQKKLKVNNVIPPTASSTPNKPTSPSSSTGASGPTSPVATETPSSGSAATPTKGEESTKGIAISSVATKATSTKPTTPAGTVSGPTSSKPSGPASSPSAGSSSLKPTVSTSSGPTSKPSASGATSSASSGSSPQPTSESSTQAASGPTSAKSSGTLSKPTSSSGSPSGSLIATKPTASKGPTSAKVTASSGAKSSKPSSNPTSTALTSGQPSVPSSSTPSRIRSQPTSSKATASTGSKSPTSASKPTEATAPTSVQTSGSSGVKPSGQPSKPTSSSASTSKQVTESTGAKSMPTTMPTSGPTSEASTVSIGSQPSGSSSKPTVATSKKPITSEKAKSTAPTSAQTSGPTSSRTSGPTSAKSSAPSSSVKPSAATSTKPSSPTSSKPSSSSGVTTVRSSSPTSSSSSTTKLSAPSSAKPSGSSSSSTSGSSPSGASPTQSTAMTSPWNSPSVPTTSTTPAQANAFMNDLLYEMNVIRLLHGAGPLLLEKNMSQAAQKKASTLSKRGTVSDEDENSYGISTCKLAGAATGKIEAKQCVSRWYETVKNFNWPNPKVTTKSAQFARLVWKPTTHVGIGVSGNNVVVYFDPPSNEKESAKDNISPVIELSDGTFPVCPEGFRTSGKSCFKLIPVPSTWAKAIEQCAQQGATLASIQSQEENTFITGMISGSQNSDTSEAWLGFNDRISESRYQWVDGSVVSFHHFLQTEPTGVGENCVALKNTKNESGWEDRKCSDTLPALCGRPAEGPIMYKVTFLIEVSINAQNGTKKTLIPPVGGNDHATLIKEKLNSTSSKKPIEFVGELTQTGPDGSTYFSVFVKVPPGSNPSIVQPLQNYLDNHNNHMYPGSKEKVFIVSVSVNNPANGMCYSSCFTTCSNQCSPMCCSGTFIINPSAQSQAAPPYQQQTQPPVYNYPNNYPQSSSYLSSYLPNYLSSMTFPQQNSLSSTSPYMAPSAMGCVRACTRIARNDFCPPYCPKRCCRARLFRPRFFRPRLLNQQQIYNGKK